MDRGVQLAPGVVADLDKNGRLLSVEVLNASMFYPRIDLEQCMSPVEWLTLDEAEAESGLPASGLRKELVAGRLSGKREGGDWVIARHDLLNLLEDLEKHNTLDGDSDFPPDYGLLGRRFDDDPK
ncbi:MAG: DUF2283 domain-containing protein [Gemmatimonadales bacterium]